MCKTIKQRVKFKADPATVYDLLADSRKHTAFTGRQAIISRKIGGTFSIGKSDVTGINVDLVPGRRIVQAWRHRLMVGRSSCWCIAADRADREHFGTVSNHLDERIRIPPLRRIREHACSQLA